MKTENRDNSRKLQAAQKGEKKLPYIKQIYGFALWECETKGIALMLCFVYHWKHPGSHCNCSPQVPTTQLVLCLPLMSARCGSLVSQHKNEEACWYKRCTKSASESSVEIIVIRHILKLHLITSAISITPTKRAKPFTLPSWMCARVHACESVMI